MILLYISGSSPPPKYIICFVRTSEPFNRSMMVEGVSQGPECTTDKDTHLLDKILYMSAQFVRMRQRKKGAFEKFVRTIRTQALD